MRSQGEAVSGTDRQTDRQTDRPWDQDWFSPVPDDLSLLPFEEGFIGFHMGEPSLYKPVGLSMCCSPGVDSMVNMFQCMEITVM